jgi:general stress protein 26
MDSEPLLTLARKLIGEVSFCVAATQGDGGDANARIVQPRPLSAAWTVDVLTNRRCRKAREVERTGRMALLYQHERDRSYVSLVGNAHVIDDVDFKRSVWTDAHYRWNPGGPEDPATIYLRLVTQRIELWSAVHEVTPEPIGYSAAVLLHDGAGWRVSAT